MNSQRDSPEQAAWKNYQRAADRWGHGHYRTEYALLQYSHAARDAMVEERRSFKRSAGRKGDRERG